MPRVVVAPFVVVGRHAVRRGAIIRFALALTVLLVAGWLALRFARAPNIDRAEAETRAGRLLAAYAGQTGQPAAHFADRKVLEYADEWQFIWSYRPCAMVGELRIAVKRTGAARYVVLPDCSPVRGFAVRPRVA